MSPFSELKFIVSVFNVGVFNVIVYFRVMTIEEAIQQKAFNNEYLKAEVNILYTSSWLSGKNALKLKPYNLTEQQFNILRILKGQNGDPVTVRLLMERMIDKMSNASRLVDKLLDKGLVERHPCKTDRRQVDITITKKGLETVDKVSSLFDGYLENEQNLNIEETKQLNYLLDKYRG